MIKFAELRDKLNFVCLDHGPNGKFNRDVKISYDAGNRANCLHCAITYSSCSFKAIGKVVNPNFSSNEAVEYIWTKYRHLYRQYGGGWSLYKMILQQEGFSYTDINLNVSTLGQAASHAMSSGGIWMVSSSGHIYTVYNGVKHDSGFDDHSRYEHSIKVFS